MDKKIEELAKALGDEFASKLYDANSERVSSITEDIEFLNKSYNFSEGFIKGYEKALEGKWISVEEELPILNEDLIGCNVYCQHKNGWFKSIYIKVLWFRIIKLYFFCEDCKDAILYKDFINNINKTK